MISVRMMQMACNQIVRMAAMRNGGMPAVWPVNVFCVMPGRGMIAAFGIGTAHFNDVFIHMVAVRMMQVAAVQVIRVPLMFNRHVTAARPVFVLVIFVFVAIVHINLFVEYFHLDVCKISRKRTNASCKTGHITIRHRALVCGKSLPFFLAWAK